MRSSTAATTVLLVPAVVNKEVSYADAYTRSQAEIRKALPLADELGIKIALENVWNNFLLSPLEEARYIDELDSPMVGAYFDVGNVLRYGWPEHWITTLGKRILKIDIKEFSRKKQNEEGLGKGFDVELLEGDCDWPAVMAALREHSATRAGPRPRYPAAAVIDCRRSPAHGPDLRQLSGPMAAGAVRPVVVGDLATDW